MVFSYSNFSCCPTKNLLGCSLSLYLSLEGLSLHFLLVDIRDSAFSSCLTGNPLGYLPSLWWWTWYHLEAHFCCIRYFAVLHMVQMWYLRSKFPILWLPVLPFLTHWSELQLAILWNNMMLMSTCPVPSYQNRYCCCGLLITKILRICRLRHCPGERWWCHRSPLFHCCCYYHCLLLVLLFPCLRTVHCLLQYCNYCNYCSFPYLSCSFFHRLFIFDDAIPSRSIFSWDTYPCSCEFLRSCQDPSSCLGMEDGIYNLL